MDEEKLYLAVNLDGVEVCSNYPLYRVWDKMTKNSTKEYRDAHPMDKFFHNCWIDTIMDTDYGYYGYDYSFEGTYLPKGTIEKLTGKKMSFYDEPIIYGEWNEKSNN